MDNNKVLLVIASLLLPPLAVFLKKGAGYPACALGDVGLNRILAGG
jgi:uncharacterized membrane protein YqaE (UPF0057 family)